MNWLLSPFGLKLAGVAVLAFGITYWHTSAIRAAKQQQAAETRTEVLNEAEKQADVDKQKYQQKIDELEANLMQLATRRAQATQRIEVITKAAETQRNEIPNLDTDAVRAAIRARLASAATGTDAR